LVESGVLDAVQNQSRGSAAALIPATWQPEQEQPDCVALYVMEHRQIGGGCTAYDD
jgi:hypothetical protein